MKILFDENSDILNQLLGFVDADIDPKKIKSEIFSATQELITLIGKAAYGYAVRLHENGSLNNDEAFLLYHFRYPIAVNAYRLYVPSGDLSHTNNGRKMRNDDYEKSAFEWMIDRDNDALEKRYYKAVDNLLDILDDENPVLSGAGVLPAIKWKQTEAFLTTHRLFVRTTADFDAYFPIQSRLLLLKLQPGLAKCEREFILPRIGAPKMALSKSILNETEATEAIDETLLALIKEACVFYALAWALRRLRVALLPEGILQRYHNKTGSANATMPPAKLEAELAAQSFEADAKKVLLAIESHLAPAPTAQEIEVGNVYPGFSFDDDDSFIST